MIQNLSRLVRFGRLLFFVMLLCLLTGPGQVNAGGVNPVKVAQGVIDLSHWDFENKGTVNLNGQWEFYWNRLITPDDLHAMPRSERTYADVPHVWNKAKAAGTYQGVATYRVNILIGPGEETNFKGLYLRGIASAYRLWINGGEVAAMGKVGMNREEMIPQNYSQLVVFPVREGENEIVIQVSNFVQRKGGLWMPLEFGNHEDVGKSRQLHSFSQFFIASALTTMGLYHMALYFVRKRDRMSLLTGIFCICMCLRVLVLGDTLLAQFFPVLQWEWAVKLEYLSFVLGIPCFAVFYKNVYPQEFPLKLIMFICTVCGFFSALILCTPATVYTFALLPFEVFFVFVLIYWVYILIVAVYKRRIGAVLNLLAATVMMLTIVNDILYYGQYVRTFDMSPYGVLVFYFVQTLVLARKHSNDYVDVEHFSGELAQVNQMLEERIQKRTEELEIANAYLVYANEHLNDLQESRRELIANITHELGTPMTSIQGYMKALLDGVIQPEQQYIQILYDKIQMADRLVQDLFDLTKLEEGQTSFQMVDVIVDELFEEHFSTFQWDVERLGIRFELIKPEERLDVLAIVRIDPLRIRQVVTNLVNNACNYTEERGTISISGRYSEDHLLITVADTGKGIDPEVLPRIFDRFVKGNSSRKYTKDGSGLGLAIAREIVMHHGGIITVQSEPGKGTVFQFDIPVEFIPMVVD